MIIGIKPLSLIHVWSAFNHDIATDLSFQQLQHLLMSVEERRPNNILLVTTAIHWGNWSLIVSSCLHTALWERLSLLQMLTEYNELHVDGPYLVGYLLTRSGGPQVTD